MHAFEFLRPGSSKLPVKPIYAVAGDDAYLRDESIRAITRRAVDGGDTEMALSRVIGDHAKLAEVLDEVRTLPFLAKSRVVVVDNADPFITTYRKELEAYAEKPSSSGVLILSAKSWPGNTKLAKLLDKVGLAIECKTPDERDLPTWLIELAKTRAKVALDLDAARFLVELVGPEVGLLASEVEKLAVYVGDRAQIRREDVARMVGSGRIEKIFAVLDAATAGDGQEALEDLDHLLASGEAPFKLIGGMTYSLRKLHHAGQLRLARVDLKSACQAAGIYPNSVEKTAKQHKHLGPTRVAAIPQILLAADLDIKGNSTLPPRVVLERLLFNLVSPRRD